MEERGEWEQREGGGEEGRKRERGGEGRKGVDQCCCTEMLEVLLSIISAQQTSSFLHTSHDELTELPASEEGGERVRDQMRVRKADLCMNCKQLLPHEKLVISCGWLHYRPRARLAPFWLYAQKNSIQSKMARAWERACNQKQRRAIVPGEIQIEDS